MPKFGTKNAIFLVFLDWSLKRILSYLKSAPSNLSNCKILRKNKMPKFGEKNALSVHFWARIFKIFLSYLKSAPSNLSKMSL